MLVQDYQKYYRKGADMLYADYYAAIAKAQSADPLASARTRDAEGTIPGQARAVMFNISGEIKNTFHEFGAPIPPLLEDCTVVDLCCGSGRDTYLAAQLVGEKGRVIGVEPNAERLAIAQKYLDREIEQFGFTQSNVEFICGVPEDLSAIPDNTADVVISNCTFNLSPDKDAYISEVRRILKEGGEFYFTDVFCDRRIPLEISDSIERVAERLGGAMYINDFRRLVQRLGFNDPRYLICNKTILSDAEQAAYPDIAFATITSRLVNSCMTEDVCESFGETVTYKGTLPDYPDYFLFDKDIKFPTGKTCEVCGNVTGVTGFGSRYAKVFEVTGDRSQHIGDTHGDHIIKTSPDFDGVVDEDDQPIRASCC